MLLIFKPFSLALTALLCFRCNNMSGESLQLLSHGHLKDNMFNMDLSSLLLLHPTHSLTRLVDCGITSQSLKQKHGHSSFLSFPCCLHWMSYQISTHLPPKYFLSSSLLFLYQILLPKCYSEVVLLSFLSNRSALSYSQYFQVHPLQTVYVALPFVKPFGGFLSYVPEMRSMVLSHESALVNLVTSAASAVVGFSMIGDVWCRCSEGVGSTS